MILDRWTSHFLALHSHRIRAPFGEPQSFLLLKLTALPYASSNEEPLDLLVGFDRKT
jgi:hypothetical protein